MKKIVIAGASGFIGKQIVKYFEKKGDTVLLLSRKPQGPHAHFWDPEKGELDPAGIRIRSKPFKKAALYPPAFFVVQF